jgi:hypothetical protein
MRMRVVAGQRTLKIDLLKILQVHFNATVNHLLSIPTMAPRTRTTNPKLPAYEIGAAAPKRKYSTKAVIQAEMEAEETVEVQRTPFPWPPSLTRETGVSPTQ